MSNVTYIDLFAGAGGLSEGFIKEGFTPVAHVEMDKNACDTIRTRLAFHYLKSKRKEDVYYSYLNKKIGRADLLKHLPPPILASIINSTISKHTISSIFGSIDDLLGMKKKVDLIVGGPPCQAYSLVGRSRDPNRMKGDKRNYLFRYYGEFLKRYRPEYFLFENVLGLLTAGNSLYLNQMLRMFEDLGYSVANPTVLNASDYGVLQNRRRVILIGRRGRGKFEFPMPEKVNNEWKTKSDLFFDLPRLEPGEELNVAKYRKPINEYLRKSGIRDGVDFVTQHITRDHNTRDLEIYRLAIKKWVYEKTRLKYTEIPKRLQTHKNTGVFLDRYKVIDPDGHSHTVVAHIAKDGHYYIYPDLNQVRSISVREAARLQSFPDDFYFEGGRTAAFRQIGNAVPPLMARAIARSLIRHL